MRQHTIHTNVTPSPRLQRLETIEDLIYEFKAQHAAILGRRSRGLHNDALSLLLEFDDDNGVKGVAADGGPRRRGYVSIKRILRMISEFEDEYLIEAAGEDREFLRIADAATRAFARWLRRR